MAVNRAEWRNGVLARIPNGGYRTAVWRAFGGWEVAESGTNRMTGVSGEGAKWNLLNTTQPKPGATNYNSVGVKNYKSYVDGVTATVETLNNGYYQPILDAIATEGLSAEDVLRAVAETPWGTSLEGLLNGLEAYQAHREFYNGLPIGP